METLEAKTYRAYGVTPPTTITKEPTEIEIVENGVKITIGENTVRCRVLTESEIIITGYITQPAVERICNKFDQCLPLLYSLYPEHVVIKTSALGKYQLGNDVHLRCH